MLKCIAFQFLVHRLTVNVYGWYGGYGTRYNSGKEPSQDLTNSVNYVSYSGVKQGSITSAVSAAGKHTGIDMEVIEVPVSTPTTEPTSPPASDNTMLVGIVSGTVVVILLIVLLLIIIIIWGRRRQPKYEPLIYCGIYMHTYIRATYSV